MPSIVEKISIEEEIVNWLNGCHDWQKVIAEKILNGEDFNSEAADELAGCLIDGVKLKPEYTFTVEMLPTTSSHGSCVELVSISGLHNVNALAGNEILDFSPTGLSVVYGDNGSGKSGYARLVKKVVGARHQQNILPNAYSTESGVVQSAVISYKVDGKERTLTWPQDSDLDLTQVHFYDEACGDVYLASNTELSYRPPALTILDKLVTATDLLCKAIERRLSSIATSQMTIPALQPDTKASTFAKSLNAETTNEQIEAATVLDADVEEQLAVLVQAEARLLGTNQAKEKQRLESGARNLEVLADHFDEIERLLSVTATAGVESKQAKALALRRAADAVSKINFAGEPLQGVGSDTWRSLWEAAEAFAMTELHHEHFPEVGNEARCPLCQQKLNEDATARLQRFRHFVQDETAKKARDAEQALHRSLSELAQFELSTITTANALRFLESEDIQLAEVLKAAIETANVAKSRLEQRLRKETTEPVVVLQAVDTEALRALAVRTLKKASKIDAVAFSEQLRIATAKKQELSDRIELAKHVEQLKAETARQRQIKKLTRLRSSLSTQAITKLAIALTRDHVTTIMNDRFASESEYLGLNDVMLGDQGGGKGRLRHKPALLGATLDVISVGEILSEGEQTALGLAGLITELQFDESGSALVLDDPITSLDHGRRSKVARRIAEIAKDRQVIVFTHDLTFLGDLTGAAEEAGVTIHRRSIEKDNMRIPGRVSSTYPWKAKDAKKRIGDLRAELARLKKGQASMLSEEYDNRAKLWAGHLSETWERLIRNDIVGKVVDRGTTEVRPKMVRLLAQITEQDNIDFQAGYSQVSQWAARHDKSEEVNFMAPSIDDMEAELRRIDDWQKRVAAYASQAQTT